MKRLNIFALVVALLLSVTSGYAQTTTTQTTLSAAMTAASSSSPSSSTFTVASAIGFTASTGSVQRYALIDKELIQVRAVSGTTITGLRLAGTSTPHVSGSVVTFGPAGAFDAASGIARGVFFAVNPTGTCGTNEYTTMINTVTGNSWTCSNTAWVESAGPSQALKEVTCHIGGAALMVDQSCFLATRGYQVVAVSFVHAVAESTAATLRVQLTKDTSTDAPGAGTDLLTNTTNAGFDCKATANTVQTGALITTLATLKLAAGDRLSLDFTAGATELVGVTITITLRPL